MKKSGLHKQIASIFDGGPSCAQATPAEAPAHGSVPSVLKRLYGGSEEDAGTAAAPAGSPAGCERPRDHSRQAQAQHSEPTDAAKAPTAAACTAPAGREGRPLPLPKSQLPQALRPQSVSLSEQIKTRLFSNSGVDPHQKKMAVLAGGLAVVFGVVLFFSLGGVRGSRPTGTSGDEKTEAAAETVAGGPAWVMPDVLPDAIRDPMKPMEALTAATVKTVEAPSREFVVKGTVVGRAYSSALINNEIIREGEEFNGIKVIRITKTEVEFEVDGQRWTQPVQP